MATYSAETQAKVAKQLITEEITWDQAQKQYGVSRSTLASWVKKARSVIAGAAFPSVPKAVEVAVAKPVSKADFDDHLRGFLYDSITMIREWAKACSDPKFIRKNPHGVNGLGRTVIERADFLVSHVNGGASEQREQL